MLKGVELQGELEEVLPQVVEGVENRALRVMVLQELKDKKSICCAQ